MARKHEHLPKHPTEPATEILESTTEVMDQAPAESVAERTTEAVERAERTAETVMERTTGAVSEAGDEARAAAAGLTRRWAV